MIINKYGAICTRQKAQLDNAKFVVCGEKTIINRAPFSQRKPHEHEDLLRSLLLIVSRLLNASFPPPGSHMPMRIFSFVAESVVCDWREL